VTVQVRMLGGFEVAVDGDPVAAEAWSRRQAAGLVKLLSLAPGHRLHRDQVVEALWPNVPLDAVGPRLHKAAHYARRALHDVPDALQLRNEMVVLSASDDVAVDVDELGTVGRRALADHDAALARRLLDEYDGRLLPDDLYEPWSERPRAEVRLLRLELLRLAERWEELLHEEPADEEAHLALVRARVAQDDVRGGLRQLERLEQAMRHELGTTPSPEAVTLRESLEARLSAGTPAPARERRRLFGRRAVGDELRLRLDEAEAGRGGCLVLSGPAGIGKSAVLEMAESRARDRGWRTGRGDAAAVEGPWPYAPVLEAFGDLCRKHPTLLDGLADEYRTEIEQALAGRDVAWTGGSGHQRLFVAATELLRLAAAGHGVMLVVDDLHEADEASLRLLHYLSRSAVRESVLVVVAHRPLVDPVAQRAVDGLLARGSGHRVELEPLTEATTRRLLAERFPNLPGDDADRVVALSRGLPFLALELARQPGDVAGSVLPALPAGVQRTFGRTALLGSTFTTDELLAVAGVGEEETYRQLEEALSALLVEPADLGYRFRHPMVREALVDAMSPAELAANRRRVAEALAGLPGPPSRVAHQFLAAGLPGRAVPFAVRAVEAAGALGAYRDALSLVDAVRPHAGPEDLPRLLARRGDLLLALGDPEAVPAYQEAVPLTTGTDHRMVRAMLARAASFANDFDTARSALAGLAVEGDAADAPILLARGHVAYFSDDIVGAWRAVDEVRDLLSVTSDPWHTADLVSLQGLIAHHRGEWFGWFRHELRRSQGKQRLATAVFDAHLCLAEYLLYGPVPYAEVIAEAEDLRQRATRAGALRGVAFAATLVGEAALLSGDLERAERELVEAVDLHRDIDASAGEAHSLQRLAEVRLFQGDRAEARRLLQQALPLARWSVVARHLLQRVYGTMITAAENPEDARLAVERAEAALGSSDRCMFCILMLAVPAAIACADVGDLDDARRHLRVAEESAAMWEGAAWPAALLEAKAHLARAEGRADDAVDLTGQAAAMFRAAGHALDAQRCEDALASVR
jgi:DNA-binding SARP family transcriptional activator/tetratricopeptide (TPR) repeat protein